MRVKYFQKLDVRGDQGNQFAPVPALQFGRAQPAQGAEHFVPNQRQQLEGDEVIAGLLAVTQHTARQCAQPQRREQSAEAQGTHASRRAQYARTAQYRNENGTQKTGHTQPHCQYHVARQGAHQLHQPPHNLKIASLHPASSCSRPCSSAC